MIVTWKHLQHGLAIDARLGVIDNDRLDWVWMQWANQSIRSRDQINRLAQQYRDCRQSIAKMVEDAKTLARLN